DRLQPATGAAPVEGAGVEPRGAPEVATQGRVVDEPDHVVLELADRVGEEAGAAVDDRLARAAGEAVGDGGGAVEARLDDGQAPPLLVRGHDDDPGPGEELVLDRLLDETVEVHPVRDPAGAGVLG